jgi:hypothetical protein
MILTEKIKVELNKFNVNHYRKLGYDVDSIESIDVKIEDIGKGSNLEVEAKCDFCEKIKSIRYKAYLKNTSKHNLYACSNKCAMYKNELTCLEKYGAKYPLQSEEIKDNLKKYFLGKFGFDNPSKSEGTKKAREKTMLERFGYKTNIIIPETHKKAVELSITKESIDKRKQTTLKNWGVENAMKSKVVYDKFKKTNIEKYGYEFPAQNTEIFDKTQKSGLKFKDYEGIQYQGSYELDLLQKMKEWNILDKIKRLNSIEYIFENSTHVYFPDFYISECNLIIEVKSSYYYKLSLNKNLSKKAKCEELNYDFLFAIDKNYHELEEKLRLRGLIS